MARVSAKIELEQAEAQMQVGQWRAAKKTYQRLFKHSAKQSSEQIEALMGLAKITQAESKFKASQAYLDQLISLHPNYLPGLLLATRQANQCQAFKRAQSIIEQTLERFPRQVDVLKLAAHIFAAKEPSRSQAILEQLLAWYPEQKECWLDLVKLYLQSGQLGLAVAALETIDQEFPELKSDPRYLDLNQPLDSKLLDQAPLIFERLILEQET